MADKFRIYRNGTVLKEGLSPLVIDNLQRGTIYPEGYFTATRVIGKGESLYEPVPMITTAFTNMLKPITVSSFVSVNGATFSDETTGLKIVSDGTGRILSNTNATGNILAKPLEQGKTYTLSAKIKVDEGYSWQPSNGRPLSSFKIVLNARTDDNTTTRTIFTANPFLVSTDKWERMEGTATITADPTLWTKYYIVVQFDNATERFTGTIHMKEFQLEEGNQSSPKPAPK